LVVVIVAAAAAAAANAAGKTGMAKSVGFTF
jgi:hypothetical protein